MYLFKRFAFLLAIFSLAFITYTCTNSTGSYPPDGGDEGSGDKTENRISSKAAPGSSAGFYLRENQYIGLHIEVDYMTGHKPTQAGLDSLKTFLQRRLNKKVISFEVTEIPSGGKDAYTISEIRSLEDQYRDYFTKKNGETLHSYFLMVDGEYENPNVIGVAYWNTSLAVFGKTIEDISSGLGAPPEEKIEGTVFTHEFGHLMGLVGNGTPTQSNHKTDGSAHCTNDKCLMYPAVETTDFFANIFNGDIPNLDQSCIEDLQANGGE